MECSVDRSKVLEFGGRKAFVVEDTMDKEVVGIPVGD